MTRLHRQVSWTDAASYMAKPDLYASLAAVTLPPKGGAMPLIAARAGRASHRALLHGLGHSAPIAIAAFALLYFIAELARAL